MTEHQVIQLFKCLADATRLQIVKMLKDGPSYVELIAQRLERTPSTISFHLKKLEEAGLAESRKEQYYAVYSLKDDALSARIIDIICEKLRPIKPLTSEVVKVMGSPAFIPARSSSKICSSFAKCRT